eukprot:392493-Prorocentrum_minimum.AAC.1
MAVCSSRRTGGAKATGRARRGPPPAVGSTPWTGPTAHARCTTACASEPPREKAEADAAGSASR